VLSWLSCGCLVVVSWLSCGCLVAVLRLSCGCLVLSCLVSCLVIGCLVLSCLVLSCLVCLAWSLSCCEGKKVDKAVNPTFMRKWYQIGSSFDAVNSSADKSCRSLSGRNCFASSEFSQKWTGISPSFVTNRNSLLKNGGRLQIEHLFTLLATSTSLRPTNRYTVQRHTDKSGM
jgi:hypothetical protein